jgi:hypothetical protein
LAALEKAEADRQKALRILAEKDEAAARRMALDLQAIEKAQEERAKRREFRIAFFLSLNDQCKVLTPPTLEVVNEPKYGTVVFRDGQGTAATVVAKNRQHCVGTKGPARSAYYILDEQHIAETKIDTLVVRARYGNGIIDTSEYAIDLAKRTATRTKVTRQQ